MLRVVEVGTTETKEMDVKSGQELQIVPTNPNLITKPIFGITDVGNYKFPLPF